MKRTRILKRALGVMGLLLALLLCITACNGDTPGESDTPAPESDTPNADSVTEAPTVNEGESDTTPDKEYADIGDGSFSLTQDTYYLVVGGSFMPEGKFSFNEPDTVALTPRVEEEGVISVAEDGRITALKAGDYTLTVREEKYGTEAQATLHIVGDLRDNIIISVPVWRGKWVNDEQLGYMKDAGVDMVVAVSGIETADYTVINNMLKTALNTWSGGNGIRVLVHSTNDMLGNILDDTDRDLERLVSRFDGHPAMAGYHLIDEPYDCSPYAPIQRKLGVLDPDAITDVNFLPGGVYPSMLEYELRMDDYCKLLGEESVTYLSFDNYPFGPVAGSVDEAALFGNFEACRRAGLRNRVPTAFYVQAVGGFGNSYRRPDEAQLTYHMASALAYGFKWVKYWSWFVPDYGTDPENTTYNDYTDAIIGKDGKPTDLYPIATDLHLRAHTIGPILVDCEAVEVYHSGNRSTSVVYEKVPASFFAQPKGNEYAIVSLLHNGETGEQYLMLVNKNMKSEATLAFVLKDVASVVEIDTRTGEGKEVTLTGGLLSVTLKAGDYAFYKLPAGDHRTPAEPTANLAASAGKVTATTSHGSNGYFIACALDGQRTSTDERQGWRVPAGQTGEMTFIFNTSVTFNRMDLYPTGEGVSFAAQFPTEIKISVASAETPDEWTVIYEQSGIARPTTEVPVLRFDSVTASRVRIEISGGSLSVELCEIEIYNDDGSIPAPPATSYEELVQEKGVNYALGKTPIASGSAYEHTIDAWGLAYLTDGKKLLTGKDGGTNGWMAQGMPKRECEPDTCWGGVDLGATYTVNEVHIYPRQNGGYFPSAYEIQISADGETWETVYSIDDDTETKGVGRFIKLDRDRQARFVRIVARKLTGNYEANLGGYLMQVSEIEVYWN